ncbi:DBD domain binding [Mactra antiquata]
MAPSQSQIVTVVSGSALLIGVLFTLYLVRRRKESQKRREQQETQDADVKQTDYATTVQGDGSTSIQGAQGDGTSVQGAQGDGTSVQGAQGEGDSLKLVGDEGPPLPDKEGLTISTSWAILNNDESHASSPHLSPVDSETSMPDTESLSIINSANNESFLDYPGDETASNTVLEAADQDTIVEAKLPSTARLSSMEREVVTVEAMNIEYEELLKEHQESTTHSYTAAEITEALMAAQNPSQGLTVRNAEILSALLMSDDLHLKHTAVQGIANCATFSKNQDVLRDQGCLPRLSKLLEIQRMAMWLRHTNSSTSISVTINAVTNLSGNEENNKQMECCVPTLVDISLDNDTGESVCLTSLQALTNLSLISTHHGHYTRLVQRLYEFLPSQNGSTRLQALKILVNLSCNPDMVPHLLAAKAPDRLYVLLDENRYDEAVLIRVLTLLANILITIKEKNITSSSLPPDDKAASYETMYSALHSIGSVASLKNKVFLLCKHSNDNLKQQAVKVYNNLK